MEYAIFTPKQLAQALKGWRKNRQLTQTVAAGRVGLRPKTFPHSNSNRKRVRSSALDLELVLRTKSKGPAGKTPVGEW